MSDRPEMSATEGLSVRHGAFGETTTSIDEWTAQYRRTLAERSDRWLSAARDELGDVFASLDGSDAPAPSDWLGENRNLQRVSMAVAVEGIMDERSRSSAEVPEQPAPGAGAPPEPSRRQAGEAGVRHRLARAESQVHKLTTQVQVLEHLDDPRVTQRRTELWLSEYQRETLERSLGEIEADTGRVTPREPAAARQVESRAALDAEGPGFG